MNVITLDFETFFDDDYTLKKMTTEEYIRDPRFEVHGVGIRYSDTGKSEWLDRDDCANWLSKAFNQSYAVLCHHAQFDGLILSHHYGIKPALWLDTLSMARQVVGNHLSVALESLARHFHLPAKNVPYQLFKGLKWSELDFNGQKLVSEGCLHDIDLTWQIFTRLMREFPAEELRVIDMTIRMFTEPVLCGNVELLGKVWMDEEHRKNTLMDALGVDAADLQSAETFATLLRAEGVEPTLKPGKNGDIYAFAKTDEFMKELIEDDGRAGALARARLGVRSTIDQTRAERLGFMATRGPLPVYLRYCGAHTTRWSGGDSLNWQNFRRGSDIRRAIEAVQGSALIVLDLAQIECRVLNVLAGEWDVVEAFKEGRDIYAAVASEFYGRTIHKDTHPSERQFGKVLELGCGYGLGHLKLQAICRAGPMGGQRVDLSEDEARDGIAAYRSTHPAVVDYWATAGRMISRIAGGPEVQWGPMVIRDRRVILPNGGWISYETLEYHRKEHEADPWEDGWRVKSRQGWSKLYGGKLVENVVQALARVVLSQAMLRMKDLGYRIAHCTHDEVIIVVDKDVEKAQDDYRILKAEMEKSPAWLPDLPLKVEGGVSTRYEK